MGEVVDFKKRNKKVEEGPFVFQCECGSIDFRLYSDGRVICSECYYPMDNITTVSDE